MAVYLLKFNNTPTKTIYYKIKIFTNKALNIKPLSVCTVPTIGTYKICSIFKMKYTLQNNKWLEKILTHFIYFQSIFYTNINVNSLRMTRKIRSKTCRIYRVENIKKIYIVIYFICWYNFEIFTFTAVLPNSRIVRSQCLLYALASPSKFEKLKTCFGNLLILF